MLRSGRSLLLALALVPLAAVVHLVGATPASAVTKKTVPPRAGAACTKLGTRAPGTTLDCVAVGTKKQWQPKGSKLNPFLPGEAFEWTQSSNGTAPGALVSARRIVVTGYLADASQWVSSFPDNQPDDIFKQIPDGSGVRGVQATVTMVSATDASSSRLGSLTTFWLGDDKAAGCCTEGLLEWGIRPDAAIVANFDIAPGTSVTGTMLFNVTDAAVGKRPLMRLAWLDQRTTRNSFVYFAPAG
jgi:hypothetical protein